LIVTRTIHPAQADIPADMLPILNALCGVARDLSRVIAAGPLGARLGAAVGSNTDGDEQKALDLMADEAFTAALHGTTLRWYASEEQDNVAELNPTGAYGLAIDPLDGSSNIDVNVSIGTIFGIMPAEGDGPTTFLRPGRHLLAAGYFIYGPQTALLVTFGKGVQHYVLDPATDEFRLVDPAKSMPGKSTEFAINASNYRHWSKPIRAYIDDCIAGTDGPRAQNFNMRWVASLVAETHRILSRGGIFLYPGDKRPGYGEGRLRMVYECAPIAMLTEQAGGRATNGTQRILDLTPASLHARTPFVFGTGDKVDRVTAYHDLPEQEMSPLFGSRGLFRV